MPATGKNDVRNVEYSIASLYVNIVFAVVVIFVMMTCVVASAYLLQAENGLLARMIGLQANPIVRLMVVLPVLAALIVVARAATSIKRSTQAIARIRNGASKRKHRALLDQ